MTWLWTELGDKDTYLENWKFGMCVNYPSSLYVTQSTRQDLSNTLKLLKSAHVHPSNTQTRKNI